jgi:hypothetical protein
MNREGIRRLAAEDLGLATSAYAFASTEAELAAGAARHTQVPAFFAGIEEPTDETPAPRALFGFDVTRWGDPELLLGTMAHEVAHAYRRHHKLEALDREIEERLTDLTAVMLGDRKSTRLNSSHSHWLL